MKLKMTGLGLCLLVTSTLLASGVPSQRSADDYYGMALQSYLLGDFDQAFNMDSKSLELDPGHVKANALFSVLTTEKGWAPKTEIWIGGKSKVNQKRGGRPVSVGIPKSTPPRLIPGKLEELESRIQIISLLNSMDSQERYRALSVRQAQNLDRLDEIAGRSDDREAANQRRFGDNEKGFGILYLISLLALIVSGAAFWVNWKTRRSLAKRPLAPVIRLGEGENVIKLNQG